MDAREPHKLGSGLQALAVGVILSLGGACGGKSSRHPLQQGEGGAQESGTGGQGGADASAGTRHGSVEGNGASGSSPTGGSFGDGGKGSSGGRAGHSMLAAGGAGATSPDAGSSSGGVTAGDAGMAGADVEESAGKSGDAGTGGTLECGDCSLLAETCVVGVCDTELGRCSRQPVVACRSGDGCCPAGCAQDDDDDCTARRIVLAPLYSGNRREDGALGATTFAGIKDEQRFYAFFTFDLSGIEGTVASAELSLHYQAYLSPDPEEHFVVLGVTTGVEALIDPALRADVFDELQAGSQYFDTSMTLEHQGSVVPFPLDGMALGDLNARLGSTTSFGIVADGTLGNSSAVEGIRFSDGVEAPLERLSLIVEP